LFGILIPIAKYMGVKEIVPAYLDPKIQPNDLLTGVSFASGGAGYNPTTSEAAVSSNHFYHHYSYME